MNTFEQRIQFFFEHAARGYQPAVQSEFVGHHLGAVALARAEAWVQSQDDLDFHWEEDEEADSTSFRDDVPAYPLFVCMLTESGTGVSKAALDAIDLGDLRGFIGGEPKAKVVEAELALEYMQECERNFEKLRADVVADDSLLTLLNTFSLSQGLECSDASEMLEYPSLTALQRAWLESFNALWDATQDMRS